jgi:hypothetical protein
MEGTSAYFAANFSTSFIFRCAFRAAILSLVSSRNVIKDEQLNSISIIICQIDKNAIREPGLTASDSFSANICSLQLSVDVAKLYVGELENLD